MNDNDKFTTFEDYKKLRELFRKLREAVRFLPIEQFVSVDANGRCFVDWSKIDAADFKDNADNFAKTMCHIKAVQMDEHYDD